MTKCLVVLLAVAACGGAPRRVHRPGDEYLQTIRIEGNHAIATDDLIPGLALERTAREQRSIDDYQLQLDTQRIATAFQKLGYFQVEVKTRLEKHGDAATLVFVVVEGPRATVRVEVSGLPPEVPLAKARTLIGIADGAPFDYEAYDDAKLALHHAVEDAGYAHVDLVASVIADKARSRAVLRYAVNPGPRCTFGEVTIEGAEGMLADAVRDRLEFAPGEPYSESATETTQAALYASGLFTSVRVDADRDSAATVIEVKIVVARGDLNELRLGIGGGADPLTYFIRGKVQYTRLAFLTPLTTLTGDLRPEYAFATDTCGFGLSCAEFRGRALVRLTQQDLVLTNLKGDVELGYDYLTLEAYTRTGPRSALALTWPLVQRKLQVRVGWQYTYSAFTHVYIDPSTAASLGFGIGTPNAVAAYTGAVVLDLRDKPIEPTRGVYAELRGAKGTPWAGGSFDYLEVAPEVRGFWTLRGTTVAARARAGRITGDVPVIERFFAGGTSSQRGFSPRRLSPRDPVTGLVIGGAALVETSLELRHALGSPRGFDLGAVLFLDGADVTDKVDEMDLGHLHWAVGAGIRWISPIGPIGVTLAYRLNRTGPGEPEAGSRWNPLLAVGEAF